MDSFQNKRREILEEVAAGRLTPEEAAERLAALDDDTGASESDGTVRLVKLLVAGFPVRVFGDPRVREAVADGPYVLQREGDALVITAETEGGSSSAFAFAGSGPWVRSMRSSWRSPQPLTVRMRPDLALTADVTASSFVVRDVKGPLSLAVTAGGVRISGFASPIDIDLTAGSLAASGVLDSGESRLRCSAGSARLALERGSSVRVRGMATAGRLVLPHAKEPAGAARGRGLWMMDQHTEAVIGDGAGQLDVEVTTGNVVVRTEA